ncbi:37S ribosomal protein S16, mitochondrial [Tilletia horrida]|uniref:37S ribosomal protein S16, mitochondrial n=1 Tax=Tilletia horrida TaxID=155126 RepID=A0AAN6G4L4_9BASI|nr:37S ribosomal protein S16, mitochondrial [Tilletia horrida]KAK0528996.1 37S ribosomal protein S16, mitochondrial [Tilletia horrida]KAK0537413.1 37S ribosomal protein S16, mitochondrial [Tilletia horrida]
MVVRLRLARHGTRNNPFYHIVAIHNKKRRNALPIEKLGEYDPIPRWRPVGSPTGPAVPAAGPSRKSTAASTPAPAPEGSAALADVPRPRSLAQVSDVIANERAPNPAAPAPSKAELSAEPRPGYGLLMTSGLPTELRLEKRIEWNEDRIRYWLNVGAQPSKPVARLLDRAGLIPEGKWFKGMRPIEGQEPRPPVSKSAKSSSPTPDAPTATSTSSSSTA